MINFRVAPLKYLSIRSIPSYIIHFFTLIKERKLLKFIKTLLKGSYINSLRRFSFQRSAWIGASTTFYFDKRYDSSITLGEHTRVGNFSELTVAYNNHILIKDHTTFNANCKLVGDITIERYGLLSANIFISSAIHYAYIHPTWTVKEQDKLVFNDLERLKNHSSPVHIEEDVWIGLGAIIKTGVYVGRGAVIGAYTLVNEDVPPYSIQVGNPNKELKKRFDFIPPASIDATLDEQQPYFYRGFNHLRAEISKEHGLKCIDDSIVTLEKTTSTEVKITLEGYNPAASFKLPLTIANNDFTEVEIPSGEFSQEITLKNPEVTTDAQGDKVYNTLNKYMKTSYTCLILKPSQKEWYLRKVTMDANG